jgi:hypothetical protein
MDVERYSSAQPSMQITTRGTPGGEYLRPLRSKCVVEINSAPFRYSTLGSVTTGRAIWRARSACELALVGRSEFTGAQDN